ncbi:hypothetical protein BIY22_08710 [Vibrio panuliri]|uniref:Uncharacterized protein n=1 Tax=Vibrio panuliri TaxID=1381081 RepID=A0A1Q9HES3_9VIBR|nr:hypothetical protein [Vibrio panuliri]OLQ88235.1 hypothetical protein BIY22_08710 [Vibrio panuliri]
MQLEYVTEEDCGRVDGSSKQCATLYSAIKETCPDDGAYLYELIIKEYDLGIVNPSSWVEKMNFAIKVWNDAQPTDRDSIINAFELSLT